ncbi:MAG: PAS domain S-box protein [Porticoccaceae bacterium]
MHDKRHFTSDGDDIVGLWIDITRRKELELESKYYKAIVDSSEDAIISKSLDGFITSWNRAAEQMFGYSSMEVVGKPMEVVFPPDRLHEEKIFSGRSLWVTKLNILSLPGCIKIDTISMCL